VPLKMGIERGILSLGLAAALRCSEVPLKMGIESLGAEQDLDGRLPLQ